MTALVMVTFSSNQSKSINCLSSSNNSEQIISRFFHRPHTPPSSAMLMEKRLIFCIISDEGETKNDFS